MDRTVRLPYNQVGRCVAREPTAEQEIAILKSVGHDIHLIETNSNTGANVMTAANHVEGVVKCVNVRPTHKRSEPAIPQRPVGAELRRAQPATEAGLLVLGQARRSIRTLAVEVRAHNTQHSRFADLSSKLAVRGNEIEDPVVAGVGLVDVVWREDVRFRYDNVAAVIGYELVAAKRILLGPRRRSARHVRVGLIVAEPGEGGIIAGEVVIQSDRRVTFVEPPHGNIGVIDPVRDCGTAHRKEIYQSQSDRVG